MAKKGGRREWMGGGGGGGERRSYTDGEVGEWWWGYLGRVESGASHLDAIPSQTHVSCTISLL